MKPSDTAIADAKRIVRLCTRCSARKVGEPMPGDCRHPDYKAVMDARALQASAGVTAWQRREVRRRTEYGAL